MLVLYLWSICGKLVTIWMRQPECPCRKYTPVSLYHNTKNNIESQEFSKHMHSQYPVDKIKHCTSLCHIHNLHSKLTVTSFGFDVVVPVFLVRKLKDKCVGESILITTVRRHE